MNQLNDTLAHVPVWTRTCMVARPLLVFLPLCLALLIAACAPAPAAPRQVVVYTSVDQPVAEPILAEFERVSGIDVLPVFDVEATKTTGLVNRLIAEKGNPAADVFWNNEIVQTLVLKDEGVLAPYNSPAAQQIPAQHRDPDGYWASYAARARVIIVNTQLVDDPASVDSLDALLDPRWEGEQVGMAYPLFGTTATHAAALYEAWGAERARTFFGDLAERGVRVVDGNGVVRDLVASGQLAFGLTDTDDACGALARGQPVVVVLPDQDSLGTLLIPGTVGLVAGAPHEEQGKALIDYLLSADVEQALLDARFSHIPLHRSVSSPDTCINSANIRGMAVDYEAVYRHHQTVQTELREVFLR